MNTVRARVETLHERLSAARAPGLLGGDLTARAARLVIVRHRASLADLQRSAATVQMYGVAA